MTTRLPRTLLLCALVACSPAGGQAPPAVRPSLESVIGAAPCQREADCRTAVAEWNPCGGPARFIAWSIRATPAAELAAALAARPGPTVSSLPGQTAGVCVTASDPGARCVGLGTARGGRCELRNQPHANPGVPAVGPR